MHVWMCRVQTHAHTYMLPNAPWPLLSHDLYALCTLLYVDCIVCTFAYSKCILSTWMVLHPSHAGLLHFTSNPLCPLPPPTPSSPSFRLTNVQFDAAYFISLSPIAGRLINLEPGKPGCHHPHLAHLHFPPLFFSQCPNPHSPFTPTPVHPSFSLCCGGGGGGACIAPAVWSIVSDLQQTNWPLGIYWQQTPQRQTQSWEHEGSQREGAEGCRGRLVGGRRRGNGGVGVRW